MPYRKLNRLLVGTSALVMSGVSITPLAAQENADQVSSSDYVDGDIIVTAARREQSLQDVALSVTAIIPDELARGGLVKLREVVEFTPGVNFAGGSSPSANTITMRGVAQAGRATTIGIYIDDVPIGSSNSFAAGPGIQFDAVQGDLERIELIKGPQGTSYGSSSMGGVIRYITKDPSGEDFGGKFKVDISSIANGSVTQNYSGRIVVPIVDDKLGISLSGYHEDFGGFVDRAASSPTGAAVDVDNFTRNGIYAKLVANPSEALKATFLYVHTDAKSTGTNEIALQGPPFVPANGRFLNDVGASDGRDKFDLYAGTFNYDFGWGTLISSTSIQERTVSNAVDLVATFGGLVELLSGAQAGSVTAAPFTGLTRTKKFVQELRLVSAASDNFEWSVGGMYSNENSSNIQRLEGRPSNFLALDVDLGSQLKEYAGFANATYYVTPDLDFSVGARLAGIESSVSLTDGPQLLVANLPETTSTDTVDTYSFAARYRPSSDLSLYARVASGYRPENANLPLLDAMGNNAAPAIIATDTLWSYEVGAKGSLADELLSFDLSVWYLDWKNLQAVTFVNGATTGGNTNSDVTAYGFEGSLVLKPAQGVSVISTVAYTNSTVDNDETAAFGAVAGENLQLLPEWTASVRASYDFSITDDLGGFISGGLRYTGSRDTGFDGGIGAGGVPITPLIANFTLEDSIVGNLNFGITKGPVTASIYINNLFDTYAFTGGSARPIVGGVRATANILQPRTVGAVIAVDF